MINREKLYSYMNLYHGPVTQSTNGYFEAVCPICGRRKFAFNPTYLTGKCFRGCFRGFLVDLIKIYHGINYFEALELIDSQPEQLLRIPAAVGRADRNSTVILPKGYHSILDGITSLAIRAREYLEGRNFDLNLMDRLGVGYCDEGDPDPRKDYLGYIIIPFKKEGSLVYFIGRDFIGNYQRYKNPVKEGGIGKSELLFNEESLYINKAVFLVEGWACACTLSNAVSMQGSTPSVVQRNLIIKSPIEELYICTDAGYYLNGLKLANLMLAHKRVKVLNLDWFEENKIGKDPNAIGKENILNVLKETPYMDHKLLYEEMKKYNKMPVA